MSAALLTKKDTFLSYNEFNQLLYSSGVCTSHSSLIRRPGQKVVVCFEENMQYPLPAIFKPEPLWTGKQVISHSRHSSSFDNSLSFYGLADDKHLMF